MGYYIDLRDISIEKYKEILKTSDRLPGRMILKENIDPNFNLIKSQKIQNVDELLNVLKNKNKLRNFARQSGLPDNYLTILIREIKRNRQNPVKINDFPDIAEDTVLKLEKVSIKNTLQLFDKILTSKSRKDLSEKTGIDKNEILKLTKLTDFTRIR